MWAINNKVQRWLDMYFPEFTEVFSDWEGKAAILTLEKIGLPYKISHKNSLRNCKRVEGRSKKCCRDKKGTKAYRDRKQEYRNQRRLEDGRI